MRLSFLDFMKLGTQILAAANTSDGGLPAHRVAKMLRDLEQEYFVDQADRPFPLSPLRNHDEDCGLHPVGQALDNEVLLRPLRTSASKLP